MLKETLVLSIICDKCGGKDETLFREPIEILKFPALIHKMEEYQMNIFLLRNDWKKHKSRT